MKTIWLYASQEKGQIWLALLSAVLPKRLFALQFLEADPEHLALQRALQTAVPSPHLILVIGSQTLTKLSQICRTAVVPTLYLHHSGNFLQIGPATQLHSGGPQIHRAGCLACWEWQTTFFYNAPAAEGNPTPANDEQQILSAHLRQHLLPYLTQQPGNLLQSGHYFQISLREKSQQHYKSIVNATCPVCSSWRWQPSETYVAAV